MTSAIVSLIILALIAFWCIRTVNDFKKKEIRVQEGIIIRNWKKKTSGSSRLTVPVRQHDSDPVFRKTAIG